jgi:HEAT repeat protein
MEYTTEELGKQNALSEHILQAILRQLEISDESVRRSAIAALGKQTTLSEDILQAIVRRLGDFHKRCETVCH